MALQKYLKLHSYNILVFILILVGISVRFALMAVGWPSIDSDEGTMGIMALHIAYHGEYPLFFYGQGFMGSLEAYLAAIVFHLIGPSVFALRVGTLCMFACFLVSMYLLTRLLYSQQLGVVTLLILSFGTAEMVFHQIEAAGGYPETLLFGTLLLLYASWLALSSQPSAMFSHRRWRFIAYGGFGFVIGVALWSDILVLPFVLMSCLLVACFCLREMRVAGIACVLAGFLVSIMPTIVYNLSVPLNQGSFAILGIIFTHASNGQVVSQPSLLQKIAGTLLVSLPLATGASVICPILPGDAWPLSGQSTTHTLVCTAVHATWGLGSLILWVIAVVLALRAYWQLRYQSAKKSWEERRAAIRQCARLMVLGSAGLTCLIYLLSAPSALGPWPGSRYLVGLQIATPAILAPLWNMASTFKERTKLTTLLLYVRYSISMLIVGTFLLGTIGIFTGLKDTQSKNAAQAALVRDLVHLGATHIYSDYWTCDRIAFQSNERILCATLDEQLQPGLDRYLPYRTIVHGDPHAAYAFPVNSPQAMAFAAKVATSNIRYQRFAMDGYVVYEPGWA